MDFRTVTDQIGRTVRIPKRPLRIVSLVPSQTELLFDLGLNDRVVGITKFCVHPDVWFRNKTRVGGTKKLNFVTISALKPDLIIANKEENNRDDIAHLEQEFPVWVSDVNDLDSALKMIDSIGQITDSDSVPIRNEIELGFGHLKPIATDLKTLYLIWKSPYMAAGSDTFIHDMMLRCGFRNVVGASRYPELTGDGIVNLNPALVLLSSEPFPFNENHIEALQNLLPNAKIALVDGEMFSWYGSRLSRAPAYFKSLKFE